MSVFKNYAAYYDLLYRDKDYSGESAFVDQIIQTHGNTPKTTLELGCGTGMHAIRLTEKGYRIHGIDFSREMLQDAAQRLEQCNADIRSRLRFQEGDVRSFRAGETYDAVISLFHVFSYQTTDEDLQAAFATISAHLNDGGIFLFDCWYGPAVLSDPPVVRVKRLENDNIRITRIAEPQMFPNENRVDVHYQILIEDKKSGDIETLQEIHHMRYLFLPEIRQLLKAANLTLLDSREWMSNKAPGLDTWGVYFVGKK